jgi:hypothetical protein
LNRSALALAAGLALVCAPAAHAQTDANRLDARCMVADAYKAGSTADPQLQSVFVAAGFFYMGRISVRDPKADVQSLMAEAYDKVGPDVLDKEAVRCQADLDQMGKMAKSVALALNEMAGLPPPRGKGADTTVSTHKRPPTPPNRTH